MKRPEGIFPYISTPANAERLADAVENTCAQEGVIAPPREAIIEGLASALGDAEIKKLMEYRSSKRGLAPSSYRVVNAGDEKVLLLICDVHGAGVVPWDLNDRAVGAWTPPSEEALQRVAELITAERDVTQAEKNLRYVEMGRDALQRAGTDVTHSAAALATADDQCKEAARVLADARYQRDRVLSSLGNRRPRPLIRAAEQDGEASAAFALSPQSRDVAVHLQRYGSEQLRRSGRRRGYDLEESLAASGQLSRGMCALQEWQIQRPDGETDRLWRMVAVTANNRALARLNIFGVRAEDLVTGMPQPKWQLPNEAADHGLLLLNQREVLNRISHTLNAARSANEANPDHAAYRAAKITTVPAEIVVGCSNPAGLEHVLRALNVDDHLRGVQPYEEDARLIALWAILVDAYANEEMLLSALGDSFPNGRAVDRLEENAVRTALTANGPLDALIPLLPLEEAPTPAALRDVAIRAITALIFPRLSPEPQEKGKSGRRKWRDTGVCWPIVRGALQEPAWSQIRRKDADARTRLWSAAVAQLYLHRGNILAANGLFGASDAKEGFQQDPRSIRQLLLEAEAGDPAAWSTLVDRIIPNLIHAPEPLITPGQGSEAGNKRKGVRRTPTSAVAALKTAFTRKSPTVTRELLIAFAKVLIAHPDATDAPQGPNGATPICYSEQDASDRSPIVPGMVLAPDLKGNPTNIVIDKGWFDDTFPPDAGLSEAPTEEEADEEAEDGDSGTTRLTDGEGTPDPRALLDGLRRELPARIEVAAGIYERAVQGADELLGDFEAARRIRIQLEEEPLSADQRIEWMERLAKLRDMAQASVTALQHAEILILQM
ncbi:hypothetical protein EDD29_0408 [Actinocorallia herbida]|uniref:Uncharacterized protein n=1 Tax=Actinocorallia herbida TaxID=58109 RepID=A0A3N1CNS5_9ACTN|nr:hypothetical protein [Actinocorallia herbida]ROO82923.1 hypothetical protein EDD29_0408 [Actinocorallia herbida]